MQHSIKFFGPWRITYAHDHRAHRHRCFVCNRVLNADDAAYMAKVGWRKTRAIHEACGDVEAAGWTGLIRLAANAIDACEPGLDSYTVDKRARAVAEQVKA